MLFYDVRHRWIMSVYTRDILRRLPQILATCTGIFGSVLKFDSTKKVCKNLQGMAAGSASWCTNVGNEKGEVLESVLTESEGMEGLHPMAIGLIERLAKKVVILVTRRLDTRRLDKILPLSFTLTGIAWYSKGQ